MPTPPKNDSPPSSEPPTPTTPESITSRVGTYGLAIDVADGVRQLVDALLPSRVAEAIGEYYEGLVAEIQAERGVDPTRIERLKRRGKPNLAAALAELQRRNLQVSKGETAKVPTKSGGSYTYSYANITDLKKVVFPVSGELGLAFVVKPTLSRKWAEHNIPFVLKCRLVHAPSGETDKVVLPIPDPRHATWQEVGSAITYGSRYALSSMTGVTPGGDDTDAGDQREQRSASGNEVHDPSGRAWDLELMEARDIPTLQKIWREAKGHGELTKELADGITAKGQAIQAAEQAARLAEQSQEADPQGPDAAATE